MTFSDDDRRKCCDLARTLGYREITDYDAQQFTNAHEVSDRGLNFYHPNFTFPEVRHDDAPEFVIRPEGQRSELIVRLNFEEKCVFTWLKNHPTASQPVKRMEGLNVESILKILRDPRCHMEVPRSEWGELMVLDAYVMPGGEGFEPVSFV
jgi:hypothetical protein